MQGLRRGAPSRGLVGILASVAVLGAVVAAWARNGRVAVAVVVGSALVGVLARRRMYGPRRLARGLARRLSRRSLRRRGEVGAVSPSAEGAEGLPRVAYWVRVARGEGPPA